MGKHLKRKKVNFRIIREEILDIMDKDGYNIIEAVDDWASTHEIPIKSIKSYLDNNLIDKLKLELTQYRENKTGVIRKVDFLDVFKDYM